nr:PREDICTED: GATA-type zinc finger protein 1 [Paralichthys olivaceus]XP_019939940.1 PREDICTED: GATA-type zinc finger protein 1 [Paralichthys olivaceus]XP_019939941.1 PREDICTED: GATA-type zinc finger protein 1 [Paralichthys olivaceus]
MSTGPTSQATFIQGHQRTVEHDASHSALFYLLQEVSRLASPSHSSFLGTNSPCKWLDEASTPGDVIVETEVEDEHFFQRYDSFSQHSVSPFNQVNKVEEESHNSTVMSLIEPHQEGTSPLKVLSLINLQCERILHRRDVEEPRTSSVSSKAKSVLKTARLSTAAADVTEQGVGSDTFLIKRQEIPASVRDGEDVKGVSIYKYSQVGCSLQPQPAEITDTVLPELMKDNATTSSQPQPGDKREAMFNVNAQLELSQECKMDFWNVPFSEKALSQAHMHSPPINTQMTLNSNEDTGVDLPKPALTVDYNANIVLTPCDTQLSPLSALLASSQSALLYLSAAERCHSFLKTDNKPTGANPSIPAAIKEESPTFEQLKSSSYNVLSVKLQPELRPVQKQEIAPPSSWQWRTKTPRKQPHPSRSVDIQDPDIQGVTFRMGSELDDSREQCRLLITSKYSKELFKCVRKPRPRTRTSQKSLKTSSSDEESDLTVSKDKVCASCCTRKTPMWRDAEDGTPLCNACGIRYKKYRVRCVNCWHIPRKEGNSNSCCLRCGNLVRLTSAQRKHTT